MATASKPSAFPWRLDVVHGGRTWTLQAPSAWRRTMDLFVDGRETDAITPSSLWSRRASANLPDVLRLPVQIFVVCLAVLLWKRDDEAPSAASAASAAS